MCQNNECCDENFNGRIFVAPVDNPNPDPGTGSGTGNADIDVIGVSPIRVRKFLRGTTQVYEISLYVPQAPSAGLSVNPSFVEFNVPFTATYTGTFARGSEDITTKTVTPQPIPVPNLTSSPFTFTVADTPTQVGTRYVHTLRVVDAENQEAVASRGVDVYYRYYRGLIPRNGTLNASSAGVFESGVGASIQAVFGAKRHYINASGSDGHFAWLRPVDSPQMGTPVGDGNFPYEIVKEPYTVSLNGAQYEVIRTVNFYPTSTDVELSF